jgi:hypothetical protein
MVVDLYSEARSLAITLRKEGLADWASKLDDIVDGGATATEILMGLRWTAGQILDGSQLNQSTRVRLENLRAAANSLLA